MLGGVLNTPYSYPVAVVTAADASEAFAARNRLLYSWLAVQAVITLAALVAAYHYERLQELNARQSRFVADLTHELKTPLTSLIGYADLLRGGTLDAERRRTAAEALYHESARLESLSQQLLALNGLQADGVVLRPCGWPRPLPMPCAVCRMWCWTATRPQRPLCWRTGCCWRTLCAIWR